MTDDALINAYRRSIPQPNTAYREALRNRLAARRDHRRPFLVATAALAAAAVILIALFRPHSATPASARAILEGLVQAQPGSMSGTAEITYASPPLTLPLSTAQDVGYGRIDTSFAVRDATHYRIDTHVVAPVLDEGTNVEVANGRSLLWYYDVVRVAIRDRVPRSPASVSDILSGGALPPVQNTIQQYLATYRKTGAHATILGTQQMLGQHVYVIKIWPIWHEQSGDCGTPKPKTPCRTRSYGHLRLWVDDVHHLILRSDSVLPVRFGGVHHYQVTALTFGEGPSAEQLAYTPPVPILHNPQQNGGESGLVNSGSAGWHPPAPFLPASPPTFNGRPSASRGGSEEHNPVFLDTASDVSTVFVPVASPGLVLPPLSQPISGPYLYIDERLRKNGLPPAFATAQQHTLPACTLYTGQYADGILWVGLQRGDIAILLTSNALTSDEMQAYAAKQFCG